ncbi:MAG: rhomboid family intramembrane serine protease [Gammaproteobacteria bacterium]|nr:rhomboid family intramembrane serine protease [Gammaproteobacteria bacterium]
MFSGIPAATRALILVNVAVFLLQQGANATLIPLFALWPLGTPYFHPWQLLSYAFLHGSVAHIFLNMFALFMFGRALETYWGARRFTLFYFICVLSAGLTQLLVQGMAGNAEPVLGASGGVFGVLLAFAWYFPRQRLLVLPIPIPVPAWLFVTGYALIELFSGLTGAESGVAHFAHLGGMLGGVLCILYWQARRRFSSLRR